MTDSYTSGTSTSSINMINIQVIAQDQLDQDRADGTYDANKAADAKYYLWHGDFQTIPIGLSDDPAQDAKSITVALPGVTTLRIPFNDNSFNDDGSLDPRFEDFLTGAADAGLHIVWVYADGEEQRAGSDGTQSSQQVYNTLSGEAYQRMTDAWSKMLDWSDAHPSLQVDGYELVNEPAAFARGVDLADDPDVAQQNFGQLYATQMGELSQMIGDRSDTPILVGGWGYSGTFDELASTTMPDGQSAIDYLRSEIGDRLIWSAHLYPGWAGSSSAQSSSDLDTIFDQQYGPISGDPLLITETNASGQTLNSPDAADTPDFLFPRNYEWFADHGIGISWFPGLNTGASSMAVISGENIQYRHLGSMAAALNGMSLDGDAAFSSISHSGEFDATLVDSQIRNDTTDPDYLADAPMDPVDGVAFGFGGSGNDTIHGLSNADNLLYGGDGQDRLIGAGSSDNFLYGQSGNDLIEGGNGQNYLFGGDGDDTIDGAGQWNMLTGGDGADLFSSDNEGQTYISDFDPRQGDRLTFDGAFSSLSDLEDHASAQRNPETGLYDLIIDHGDGASTTLSGAGSWLDKLQYIVPEFSNGDPLPPPGPDEEAVNFNQILGTSGDDRFHGTTGDDSMDGGAGNDVINGWDGNDYIVSSSGNDTLYGVGGDDTLVSSVETTKIVGGDGNDSIYMDVSENSQRASGGDGQDSFHISNTDKVTTSRIEDFDPANDSIIWNDEAIDFSNLPDGVKLGTIEGVPALLFNEEARILLGHTAHGEGLFPSSDMQVETNVGVDGFVDWFNTTTSEAQDMKWGLQDDSSADIPNNSSGDTPTSTNPPPPQEAPSDNDTSSGSIGSGPQNPSDGSSSVSSDTTLDTPTQPSLPKTSGSDQGENSDTNTDHNDQTTDHNDQNIANASCFVATAAYGGWDHPDVCALRNFRDNVLLPHPAGRYFIKVYWIVGPKIARYVDSRKISGLFLRSALSRISAWL